VTPAGQVGALPLSDAIPLEQLRTFLAARNARVVIPMLFNEPDNPKNCLFPWGIWFVGHPPPPESALQKASQSVRQFFPRLTNVTNTHRHTDHTDLSVAIGRYRCNAAQTFGTFLTNIGQWCRF